MNEFTVTLLVLGLPGIISYFLCYKLRGKPNHSTMESVLLIFVYSVISYTLVGIIEACIHFIYGLGFQTDITRVFLESDVTVNPVLLIQAVSASIITAYAISYILHYNIPNRLGQKIKATQRYGDEDVWHYFHNAPDAEKNEGWVMVRDLKADLAYHCYISTWSDTGMDRELVISEASVYSNSSGEYLYDAKHIYLSRNKDELMIEIPPENAIDKQQYNENPKTEDRENG